MITDIETYLNSLSKEILTIDISGKGIQYLPDLTRFKKLKVLRCNYNKLTYLPDLTKYKNLKYLFFLILFLHHHLDYIMDRIFYLYHPSSFPCRLF